VTHSGLLTHISAALTTQTVAYVGRFDAAEPFLSSILINAELPPFGSLNLGSHGGLPSMVVLLPGGQIRPQLRQLTLRVPSALGPRKRIINHKK